MDKKSRSQGKPRTAPRKVTDLPPRKVQDVKGGARYGQLGDIKGESTDIRHKDEIEILG